MQEHHTIAAISTPVGQGGIGIVRLSGRDALRIAERIFRSPGKKEIRKTPSHRILYGSIVEPGTGEVVDEVLVSVMKAPKTYTKEDMVEIHCHGGPVPLKRVLELLLSSGAGLAQPGEFTRRAFLNGRIDLAQAEAVLDMINALTVESQKAAMQQLSGGLSEKIAAVRERAIELTALVEAHIDFPEEDMTSFSLEDLHRRADIITKELKDLISTAQYGRILRDGIRTAIIGRPNVGKSSLLNALAEHDRAIVTEVPGTTRDVIEEYLNIRGLPVRIMDTAGIREVRDMAEQEGVRRSLRLMDEADLILLVLDGSEPLHDTDRELIEKSSRRNTITVLNKCDLPDRAALPDGSVVKVSAKHGAGLDALKERIVETASGGLCLPSHAVVTNSRHVHALEKTLLSMESFREGLSADTPPEFLAVSLRSALDALGDIIGATTPEDVLDRIFSTFCIGK